MRFNGLPVEAVTSEFHEEPITVAQRSRFQVFENGDGPWPGEVIEAGRSLAEYDPRYLEHLSMFTDDEHIDEGDEVVLSLVDVEEHVHPCVFCNPKGMVAERGVVDSDYEMRKLTGELLGYSCISCLADAPIVDGGGE